jgi:hypothetical protein
VRGREREGVRERKCVKETERQSDRKIHSLTERDRETERERERSTR